MDFHKWDLSFTALSKSPRLVVKQGLRRVGMGLKHQISPRGLIEVEKKSQIGGQIV